MAQPINQANCYSAPLVTTPSRFELTVLYFLAGAHLVLGTDAVVRAGWDIPVTISLFFVFLWFLVRFCVLILKFKGDRPRLTRWIESVIVVGLLITVHASSLGLAARVYFSEGDLLEEVKLAQNRSNDGQSIGRSAGLFVVHAVYKRPGYERVLWLETVSGSRVFGPQSLFGGLVYCERALPPPFGESHYRHLYGPWWLWIQDV